MENIIFAVIIGILFGCFVFVDGKRREAEARLGDLVKDIEEIRKDLYTTKTALTALSESVRVRDKQEQAIFEGMNSILNYSEAVARKAVHTYGNSGDEED